MYQFNYPALFEYLQESGKPEQLNLIMHYHNHRRYRDGVRKGKTPMEILTGKEQAKDWIAILLEIIREKKPELLLAS